MDPMLYEVVCIVLILLGHPNISSGQDTDEPTECDRGVRRHHPSQANAYQVFSRSDYQKQWIDYSCPELEVFDPRACRCVAGRKVPAPLVTDRSEQVNSVDTPTHGKGHKQQDGDRDSSDKEPDCQLHRPTEDSEVFERWSDGKWVKEDCNWPFYTGLVWNQRNCRCEWGPNRTLALPLSDDGVPATCLMMLHMTFDTGAIVDEGRNIWLNIRNPDGAAIEKDSTAVGGYAGTFRGSAVVVPFFKSNVLGDTFHVGLSFKLCPGQPDTDIILVHNDCPESEDGASIVVSYQAWNRRITVALRTINTETLVDDYCTLPTMQPNQWVKLDIRYAESFLEVSINDDVCLQSDKHYGLLATNTCPLTLLGDAFCGSLDEVIITRGCTEAHAVS